MSKDICFDPNPLFFKMLKYFKDNKDNLFDVVGYNEPIKKCVRIFNEGGSRCFGGNQKVVTNNGSVSIKDVVVGDLVKTFNEGSGLIEWKPVEDVLKFNNKKRTIKITLKNGEEIVVTDDHKFFHKGAWVEVKYLLSLFDKLDKYEEIDNN